MKKIEAIVHPARVEEVREALAEIGVTRLETAEVKGFGRRSAHVEVYRGSQRTIDYTHEVKIEIVLQDRQVEAATAILEDAIDAEEGDESKLLIFNVEGVLRRAEAVNLG